MATGTVLPPGHDDEVREVSLTSDALAVLNRSELDQQIEIARKYPRSVDKFRKTLTQYATLSPDIALTMFYSLPRADKMVVGPSVRFAEPLVTAWGNCRAGIRILGEQGNVVAAQGIFFDCESNLGINLEANRSIVNKKGQKFSGDMIVTTSNAAASIAYRNAILRGVPQALWQDVYELAKNTAVGKAESFVAQVMKAVEEFGKQGVTQTSLLNLLKAPSIRDINQDHIILMRTIFREIREGDKTIEDVFGSPEDAEIDALMEQLGMNATQQRMGRDNYRGRRSEHLDYLRSEAAKKGQFAQQKDHSEVKKDAQVDRQQAAPTTVPQSEAPVVHDATEAQEQKSEEVVVELQAAPEPSAKPKARNWGSK